MKSNFPLILAWIWILIAAVGGCGWREVDRGTNIKFNWDRHTLEVETEGIFNFNSKDRRLEIVFNTERESGRTILKIFNFYLTQGHFNGVDDETLWCNITFQKENKQAWTQKPLDELRWIFKKNEILNSIEVELVGNGTLKELVSISDEDRTEMFQFGLEDNISLLYRVNSIDGDDDCVNPGNKTSK